MHRRNLLERLNTYLEDYPDEAPTVQRFRDFVSDHERCFERDCWAGHVTGSAWLVSPDRTSVLLTHHRKLDIWVQLGGHSDGDADTLAVARREGEEESGLQTTLLADRIFDIDIHEIPARKTDPAHFHFDVRFAFVASSEDYQVSPESKDLSWVPVDQLQAFTREESMLRMARKWRHGAWSDTTI